MKIVKRTPSFDSDDHNVIVAAGESSQTDCAAFIEQQKKLLLEYERSVSVPTEGKYSLGFLDLNIISLFFPALTS